MCNLIKTPQQFQVNGCENCTFLRLNEDPEAIEQCTTTNFDGMIAMMNPEKSWVAKWQRMKKTLVPGCYAIAVHGRLPSHVVAQLDELGIKYKPRE